MVRDLRPLSFLVSALNSCKGNEKGYYKERQSFKINELHKEGSVPSCLLASFSSKSCDLGAFPQCHVVSNSLVSLSLSQRLPPPQACCIRGATALLQQMAADSAGSNCNKEAQHKVSLNMECKSMTL